MVNSKHITTLPNQRLVISLIALVIGFVLWGCGDSGSDAPAIGPDGARLTNAELVFITRGSLEGEIGPNG